MQAPTLTQSYDLIRDQKNQRAREKKNVNHKTKGKGAVLSSHHFLLPVPFLQGACEG